MIRNVETLWYYGCQGDLAKKRQVGTYPIEEVLEWLLIDRRLRG